MDWRSQISKLWNRMTKEKWIILLAAGAVLMVLAIPLPGEGRREEAEREEGGQGSSFETSAVQGPERGQADSGSEGCRELDSYEAGLEKRIASILSSVDGVGAVDVMVVLRSSGEKVLRVDRAESLDTTRETDSAGGTREASSSQWEENTVFAGQGTGSGASPVVEKELLPEISGIIISAQGGGSPALQSEISQAMEALFGLPPHKIKVLKRVE